MPKNLISYRADDRSRRAESPPVKEVKLSQLGGEKTAKKSGSQHIDIVGMLRFSGCTEAFYFTQAQ